MGKHLFKILPLMLLLALARPARADKDLVWLGVAEGLLVVDFWQTLDIKNHWINSESNPILGHHPSDKRVLLYGGACMTGTALAFAIAPKEYKHDVALVVIAIEVPVILMNFKNGLSLNLPFSF